MPEISSRLNALRQAMRREQLTAWIAPATDPHQSEYIAGHWKSREWLSGFDGSAGTLIVTLDRAALWTDTRYHLQAERQLQKHPIELVKHGLPDVADYPDWLAEHLPRGAAVGFDAGLLSLEQARKLENALKRKRIRAVAAPDLLQGVWKRRPPLPVAPIHALTPEFAGESRASKLKRLREKLQKHSADWLVLAGLDEIAWLFNLRGRDIEYNPVFMAYALVGQQEARLFTGPGKLSAALREELENDGIGRFGYDDIFIHLGALPAHEVVWLDPERASCRLAKAVNRALVYEAETPLLNFKAIKNPAQQAGIRRSHLRDGVAMVRWLHWLDQVLGKESHTEVSLADQLENFRSRGEYFQGLSFPTICGYQANGAIVHYRAEPENTATIAPEDILLVDSGAQYLDGTTDITRTLSLGNPTAQQRRHFTLVLKGHIQLASARFARGTCGAQLDGLARLALWQEGYHYGHGTGHGVGCYLNVHEGPQRIASSGKAALEPGMLTSNEPGLYWPRHYGIRIENLMLTVELEKTEFGQFYGFETVTLCPIDLDLVEPALLTPTERGWLNDYHELVHERLYSFLSPPEQAWLRRETRAI